MGRKPNLIPSVQLNVALAQDIHTQLTLHLYSELEGRVPLGAYQAFITERLREYFSDKHLDLAPYFPQVPTGVWTVSGSAEAILALKYRLGAT